MNKKKFKGILHERGDAFYIEIKRLYLTLCIEKAVVDRADSWKDIIEELCIDAFDQGVANGELRIQIAIRNALGIKK